MNKNVILRGLTLQEEYRCAWEAVRDFTNTEGFSGHIGRRYGQIYTFELEGEPDIRLEVWRSQRGIEVARPNRLDEELKHALQQAGQTDRSADPGHTGRPDHPGIDEA